jgi:hypothetical protein
MACADSHTNYLQQGRNRVRSSIAPKQPRIDMDLPSAFFAKCSEMRDSDAPGFADGIVTVFEEAAS